MKINRTLRDKLWIQWIQNPDLGTRHFRAHNDPASRSLVRLFFKMDLAKLKKAFKNFPHDIATIKMKATKKLERMGSNLKKNPQQSKLRGRFEKTYKLFSSFGLCEHHLKHYIGDLPPIRPRNLAETE